MDIFNRAQGIIQAGVRTATHPYAKSQLESIQLYDGYVEPGYTDPESGCIAVGNWNSVTKYDPVNNKFDTLDKTPVRVAKLLEKIGIELEWEDEWISCDYCGKLFRCVANSYSWQQAGTIDENGCCCEECINPEDHLKSLEGKWRRCNTIEKINPADHNYVRINNDYEHGLHPGQDASPKLIAKALKQSGIKRFLFNLDSTGQFDINFSVWVHESEDVEKAKLTLFSNTTDGPSVSESLKKALQDTSNKMSQMPDAPGLKYAECDLKSGTAQVKQIGPEEFVRGINKPKSE